MLQPALQCENRLVWTFVISMATICPNVPEFTIIKNLWFNVDLSFGIISPKWQKLAIFAKRHAAVEVE